MTCEVNNKEINSQCAELLVRPLYVSVVDHVLGILYLGHFVVSLSPYLSYLSRPVNMSTHSLPPCISTPIHSLPPCMHEPAIIKSRGR